MRSTKAIVHLENLKWNIKEIRRFLKDGTKMLVPVKANAYGHGTVECARAAVEAGADVISVATVEEGILLRQNKIKAPILLFSLCSLDEVDECVRWNLTPFVFDSEYIELFQIAAKNSKVKDFEMHLAVDTGMGRIGCFPEEAGELAQFIESSPYSKLGGMCTHLCVSDSVAPENIEFTRQQFSRFMEAVKNVEAKGINPGLRSCCNSAGTLAYTDMHLDLVRPGIIVYGYGADEVNEKYLAERGTPITLKPVMTLESEITAIRHFKKGMSVGYGRTYVCPEDTDIGVLTLGYGDGFLRRNANVEGGFMVAVNGKNYPVRGRICMDQCMIDLGKDSGVKRWDTAVLFGTKEDGGLQTADDVARMTGTISYEVTTSVSARVPRIYTE